MDLYCRLMELNILLMTKISNIWTVTYIQYSSMVCDYRAYCRVYQSFGNLFLWYHQVLLSVSMNWLRYWKLLVSMMLLILTNMSVLIVSTYIVSCISVHPISLSSSYQPHCNTSDNVCLDFQICHYYLFL